MATRRNRIADAIAGDIRKPWQIAGFPDKLRRTFVAICRLQNKTTREYLEEIIEETVVKFVKENTDFNS